MPRIKSLQTWMLGAVLSSGLLAVSSAEPNVRPDSAFFSRHPVLQFVEQRLPAGATVVIPPDPERGRHVATDLELQAALASVLDGFLAPPSTQAGKAGDLIAEVCRYRPAQASLWVSTATDSILKFGLESAEKDLDRAVASAVAENPEAADEAVGAVIGRLAEGVGRPRRSLAGPLSLTAAGRLAGNTVVTAMAAVKANPNAVALIWRIAERALSQALEEQANFLIMETMAASIRGSRGVAGIGAGDLIRVALVNHAQSKELAGIIAIGAVKGAGIEAISTVKDQAALNLSVPFASYITVMCNAYTVASGTPSAAVPQVVTHFISVTNADFIAAVMIGSISAHPEAALELLQAGLNRDLVLRGRATTAEILQAAIMACEASAPQLAAAAVGRGDLTEASSPAQIAEGLARGALSADLGRALAAQIRAQKNDPAEIKATVSGALAGAIAAERWQAVSTITFVAATGSGRSETVLDQAIISAPPGLQYAAVLGVLAADPAHAAALLDRARKQPGVATDQAAPLYAGGGLILEIQQNPSGFFGAAMTRLLAAGKDSPETVVAIMQASSLTNPRGASAIAAAALVSTDLSVAKILSTGGGRTVSTAVEIAARVKASPAQVFACVKRATAENPDLASEIVTGAMVAAPSSGPLIGRAAALAAPDAVGQIVPRLFAFCAVRNPAASLGESAPETFASLTSGVLGGVIDARLDPSSEERAVEQATATAVKSVIALGRERSAMDSGALTAVISAAAHAAQGHSVEIAREAARSIRALLGVAADPALISAAVKAGNPRADVAKVADAVKGGFAEADLQVPAADVQQLFDYAHDSLTGIPMTRFRDL